MFQFEIEVMIISIRAKAYFFNNRLFGVAFYFFKLLFLFVDKLVIVYYFTNRRHCIWGNLHQVQLLLFSHCQSFAKRINTLFYIVAHEAYFCSPDKLIDIMFGFLFLEWGPGSSVERSVYCQVIRLFLLLFVV